MTIAQVTFDEVKVVSNATPQTQVTFDQIRVPNRETPGPARITHDRVLVVSSTAIVLAPISTQPIINICM